MVVARLCRDFIHGNAGEASRHFQLRLDRIQPRWGGRLLRWVKSHVHSGHCRGTAVGVSPLEVRNFQTLGLCRLHHLHKTQSQHVLRGRDQGSGADLWSKSLLMSQYKYIL